MKVRGNDTGLGLEGGPVFMSLAIIMCCNLVGWWKSEREIKGGELDWTGLDRDWIGLRTMKVMGRTGLNL